MNKNRSSGVSTILVLGVMAILVTIIVPLLSRTVIDIRISKQQEEQARAFSAAESGLEKALIGGQLQGQAAQDINYQVTGLGSGATQNFFYPKSVEKNYPVTVWLIEHAGASFDAEAALNPGTASDYKAGTIDFLWGEANTPADNSNTPALEATFFYRQAGNYRIAKYLYDPNINRRSSNNFTAPTDSSDGPQCLLDGHQFQFRAHLTGIPCTGQQICYAVRLRLLYNDDRSHPLAVSGAQTIPRQGECFESVATVQSSGVSSRIQRCVFYRDFPAFFDFVLYSNSSLEKTVP